jgi:single-strand DNA-binding protein
MNKAILIGRLTKDPEVRYTQSNEPMAIAHYTLAVNRRFKREGEPDADFIPCVVFGKSAEFAEKYFKKGMQIAVSGRITVRSWEDQTGQRRWATEVNVDDQEFTESKGAFEARSGSQRESKPAPNPYEAEGFSAISSTIDDDDIPF